MNEKIGSFITIILIFTFLNCAFANIKNRKEVVNILTWWDYLDIELIKKAENKCGAIISYDEYYTNDEFLRRWTNQKENYQVIIFSQTIYNIIKNKLPRINSSKLFNNAEQYNKIIKNHYLKMNYPANVVYYIHSLTGFLWNPENITISTKDTIDFIFKKANNKYVAIIDDPVEFEKLILADFGLSKKPPAETILTIKNFNKITKNANVYITNNSDKIYTVPDFAFTLIWSGEAMNDLIQSNNKFKFLIHPKLSYISSDLISQTSNSNGAYCVSKYLSSKEAIKITEEKYHYFSPYADYSKVSNPAFKNMYKEFVKQLPDLPWLSSVDVNNFHQINLSWQRIKLYLNNKTQDIHEN